MQVWRGGERLYSSTLQPPSWLHQNAVASPHAQASIADHKAGDMSSNHGGASAVTRGSTCVVNFEKTEASTRLPLNAFRPKSGWENFILQPSLSTLQQSKIKPSTPASFLTAIEQFLERY